MGPKAVNESLRGFRYRANDVDENLRGFRYTANADNESVCGFRDGARIRWMSTTDAVERTIGCRQPSRFTKNSSHEADSAR